MPSLGARCRGRTLFAALIDCGLKVGTRCCAAQTADFFHGLTLLRAISLIAQCPRHSRAKRKYSHFLAKLFDNQHRLINFVEHFAECIVYLDGNRAIGFVTKTTNFVGAWSYLDVLPSNVCSCEHNYI